VTIYAAGTALAAIPLSAATAQWRRKRLLLTGVAGFAVAQHGDRCRDRLPPHQGRPGSPPVGRGRRLGAAGRYARRLAPAGLEGRATAVVMAGIPLALSLGVPAGAFSGRRWAGA
jgi:predicted MFS family arabinose efflux permease